MFPMPQEAPVSGWIKRNRKTLAAIAGAGLSFATLVVLSDPDPISSAEWLSLAVGVGGVLGVNRVPNDPTA
jgi:hypothetical protein